MIYTASRIARAAAVPALFLTTVAAPALAATPAPIAAPSPIIALPLQPVVGSEFRACSAKTASGLGTTTLREGNGPKPGKSDFVLISYIGYLASNGQVFDQNQQTPLNLGSVIPGFAEGLQLMARGSIWRLCVPAAQGYGAAGAGAAIPPNSDLVFQIELVDSKTGAEVEALRKAQEAAQAAPPPGAAPAPAPIH